jgi:hypothetical protein
VLPIAIKYHSVSSQGLCYFLFKSGIVELEYIVFFYCREKHARKRTRNQNVPIVCFSKKRHNRVLLETRLLHTTSPEERVFEKNFGCRPFQRLTNQINNHSTFVVTLSCLRYISTLVRPRFIPLLFLYWMSSINTRSLANWAKT